MKASNSLEVASCFTQLGSCKNNMLTSRRISSDPGCHISQPNRSSSTHHAEDKKSSKTRHTPFTSQRGFMIRLGKPTTDFKHSTCKFCLSFGYKDHPGDSPSDPPAKKLKLNIRMAFYKVTNRSSSLVERQVERHMQRYHPQKFAEYQVMVSAINADPVRSR
jgi:hypothetical protein